MSPLRSSARGNGGRRGLFPGRRRLQHLRNFCGAPWVDFWTFTLDLPNLPFLHPALRRLSRWGLGISIPGPSTGDPPRDLPRSHRVWFGPSPLHQTLVQNWTASHRPRPSPDSRARATRTSRTPEVASASFRLAEPGAVPVTETRSSQNATRGVSEAQAQPRPSAADSAPLPRSTKDRAGCAHFLANREPQSPGLRRWQPFQTRGECRRKPPVTSRERESSAPRANERLGKSASASFSANPGPGRRRPP